MRERYVELIGWYNITISLTDCGVLSHHEDLEDIVVEIDDFVDRVVDVGGHTAGILIESIASAR